MLRNAMLAGVSGALAFATPALAQGEDGTRAERNAQVIGTLLAGRYDNANQAYFDRRLGEPEDARHERLHLLVTTDVDDRWMMEFTRSDGDDQLYSRLLASLSPEADGWTVRMRLHRTGGEAPSAIAGCDLLWREEAGQFRAVQATPARCKPLAGEIVPATMMLGEHELWFAPQGDPRRPFALERAREFRCYMDVPGVGGGRDIPYKRYETGLIHDKGGQEWITLADGSEMSVTLTSVRWPMNNLENIFTRHSMVLYVGEKQENGEAREIAYAWTEPTAQRIGINLKSVLVNCYMLSNEDIAPFYRSEPRVP